MRISDWSSDVCSSDIVEVRELGWSARHAQRLKHIDIASGSERTRRFHPAHHRKLHPRGYNDRDGNLGHSADILGAQTVCDQFFDLGGQIALNLDLTDEWKGDRAVGQDLDLSLQPFLAPDIDLELVARVDPVSQLGRAHV